MIELSGKRRLQKYQWGRLQQNADCRNISVGGFGKMPIAETLVKETLAKRRLQKHS